MKTRIIRPKRASLVSPIKAALDVYPTVTLSHRDLPEAKDWKVGETYHVEMDIKMVGTNQSDDKNNDYRNSSEFEIKKIVVDNDADEATET